MIGTSWLLVMALPAARLPPPDRGGWSTTTWLFVAALAGAGLAFAIFMRLSTAARARGATVVLLEAHAKQLAVAHDEAIEGLKRVAEAQAIAHLGSWEWDIATGTVLASDELYRIFGLGQDCVKPSFDDLFGRLHPDDRQGVEDALSQSMQTHERLGYSVRLLTDDGEVRWIDVQAEVATGADGSVRKMTGTVLDISERARAREELEASELRFDSGFEQSPIGIALASSEGRYLKVNPALCQMLGRDEATLLSTTFQDVTHPDDLGTGLAQLEAMASGRSGSWQAEKRYLLPDGSVMWAQINSSVVPDAAGAPSYLFSQIQDITQKKALADAVVRDREFLAAVLHNLSDGVIACNADGALTLFNRATQEFHGLPVTATAEAGDWAGQTGLCQADGVTPMELDDIPLVRALRGENVQGMEMVIVPERAPRRVVLVSAQAIRDAAGGVLGAVAAMHDITEHKQAEDDLASLNADLERRVQERTAEAERANEAKSEFLSRMSHELRTPLNAMLGFAQLLGMDALPVSQAESVEHIMSGGRHLLALINDVLDLAIIESGSLAMSIRPTALGPLLDEALDLLRPQAASAHVSLPAHAPANADVHVLADDQRLRQIVVNLLSNAVKYNSEVGLVSLTCKVLADRRIRLSVGDTGPGIGAAEAERIFLPFERLAAADTAVEGTGLGLAVAKRLADAMDAEIGLTSVVGQGSTFWLDLSVVNPEECQPEIPARAWKPGPSTEPATVLYIEDNPSNLQLVRALLSRLPHIRLLAATSGHLGLELARRRLPDLVLLDLGLPDISGVDVLTRLQADPATKSTPVVVVSADATRSQVKRLLAAGATAYLTKPLDVGRFLGTVEEALQTRRDAGASSSRSAEAGAPPVAQSTNV